MKRRSRTGRFSRERPHAAGSVRSISRAPLRADHSESSRLIGPARRRWLARQYRCVHEIDRHDPGNSRRQKLYRRQLHETGRGRSGLESHVDEIELSAAHADAIEVASALPIRSRTRGTVVAITYLKRKFKGSNYEFIHSDYLTASKKLKDEDRKYDLILADLGVSSPHLNEARRGFSFISKAKLDMRMDQAQLLTADYVINKFNQQQLTKIIREYGQEPKAGKIARLIIDNRPIRDTEQLAQIVKQAWPGYSKIHPATRTFQAIRILVNDELNQLDASLPIWNKLLNPGGRLVVISFHSLEDRIIKQYFKVHASTNYDASLSLLTKDPVVASANEIVSNPRARSAKLRAAAK